MASRAKVKKTNIPVAMKYGLRSCSITDLTILHLSDFHLSLQNKAETDPVLQSLMLNIQKRFQDKRLGIPYIVISGDLTKTGKEEQFIRFEKDFLEPLLRKLTEIGKCPPASKIIFCPGNHDLDREIKNNSRRKSLEGLELHEDNYKAEELELKKVNRKLNSNFQVKILKEGMRDYYNFAAKHGQESEDLYFVRSVKVDDFTVNFVNLNSAYLFSPKLNLTDEKGGFIGKTQIENAFAKAKEKAQGMPVLKVLNIVVLHHPFANLIRAGKDADKNRICNFADMVLCGDEHEREVLTKAKGERSVPGRNSAHIFRSRCIFDKSSVQPGYFIINVHAESDVINALFWDVRSKNDGTFPEQGGLAEEEPTPLQIQCPLPDSLEIQLIDQEKEMNVLRRAVDRAVQGDGSVVFLCGEQGVGKTKISRELEQYARLCRMQVLHGHGKALFSEDDMPPYFLWTEVIKDYLAFCSSREQLRKVIGFYSGEISELVPEIRQRIGKIPKSMPISPEHGQYRMFEAISQFVSNIARDSPLLVVLDDLRRADVTSLQLLHYMARSIPKEALFLLGAYCNEPEIEDDNPLSPVLTELNREGLLQCDQLRPLSFVDCSEMIRTILGKDASKEFCDAIHKKTGGNPFFVREVIKSMRKDTGTYQEDNDWMINDIAEIDFPKSVIDAMNNEIGQIDAEDRMILERASLIGETFAFRALQEVVKFEEDKLSKIVDGLIRKKLLKPPIVFRGDYVCSFANSAMRNVLYEEVGPFVRKRLHNEVADVLEKIYAGKADEHFGELASHYLKGGNNEKAFEYFLKAGDRAAKLYANSEAASYYLSALKLLDENGNQTREKGSVLEKLGDIKRLEGEYDASIKYWEEALLLFNQIKEKETVAKLHRKTANVLWSSLGKIEKAEIHHKEAWKILKNEPKSTETSYLFDDMARLYFRTESVSKALLWAKKALKVAMKLNSREIIASSYCTLGEALSLAKDIDSARKYFAKALKIAIDNDYLETAMRSYTNLSNAIPSLEVFGAAMKEDGLEMLERAYGLAKKGGDIHWLSYMGTALAETYGTMGKMNDALCFAEESVALARKTKNLSDISNSVNVLGHLYVFLGDLNKSEQLLTEALGAAYEANDNDQIMTCLDVFGLIYIAKGDYPKAIENLEKMIDVAKKTGAKYAEYWGKDVVAEAYVELEKWDKAKELLDCVLKFATEINDFILLADAHVIMGMLMWKQKNYIESEEFFEKSFKEYEAYNASRFNVYWLAQAFYEYALMRLERNKTGDREKAENLFNQAWEIFEKMGAKKDMENIVVKKKQFKM